MWLVLPPPGMEMLPGTECSLPYSHVWLMDMPGAVLHGARWHDSGAGATQWPDSASWQPPWRQLDLTSHFQLSLPVSPLSLLDSAHCLDTLAHPPYTHHQTKWTGKWASRWRPAQDPSKLGMFSWTDEMGSKVGREQCLGAGQAGRAKAGIIRQ